jgi:molybdopterin converting factor small subunit
VATVHLPRSLVILFNDAPPRRVETRATSLAELVEELDAGWPGMRDRLCEPGPRFREHINVFVDGDRQTDMATPLGEDAVVHLIPAVAGG